MSSTKPKRDLRMRRYLSTALLIFCTALAALPGIAQQSRTKRSDPPPVGTPPLTPAEQRILIDRLIANQHANDLALPLFQRIEHRQARGRDGDMSAVEDRTARIVPTGINSGRIVLADHGKTTDPATIHEQMEIVAHAIEAALDPANAQSQRDREKTNRRMHDRAEFVDTVRDAYVVSWMGREVHNGRAVVKLHLDPNPAYVPKTRDDDLLRHATATAWIDEQAAQLVRLEADLNSDISFILGIAGKINRGAKLIYEQTEVEPGIWFPTLYQYDLTGRKLFFYFELHQKTETSNYVRVGPPSQALASLRAELSTGSVIARPPQ